MNGKIAFGSTRDGNQFQVFVMDADGTNQTRLTHDADNLSPSFSADGSTIAFTSDRDGTFEIYVMDADGSNQTRLTTNDADDSSPAISGDGTRIAFISNRNGDDEVYVMDADGFNQTRITTDLGLSRYVAMSVDGSRVAFDTDRYGNSDVFVMDVDGGNQTRLTTDPATDYAPAFSPDGTKIAFTSLRDGTSELYVMDADGSSQTRLTTSPDPAAVPVFSPDGAKIAFSRREDDEQQGDVYVMDADGGNPTRLTTDPAQDGYPSWGGIPVPERTVTKVVSDTSPSAFGQSVTFTATTTNGGTPISVGSVLFSDNGSPLGPAVAVAADGTATITTSALPAGVRTVTASFSGAPQLNPSSGRVHQVVIPHGITVTSGASANPAPAGQAVTYTATITAQGVPVSMGSVQFDDGNAMLGRPVPVAPDGTAVLHTSAPVPAGQHSDITATWKDPTGTVSVQGTFRLEVTWVHTTTALSSDANPSAVGQRVTFTARVSTADGPVTFGPVSFNDAGGTGKFPTNKVVWLGSDGTATLTSTTLTVGEHTIRATFAGTETLNASSGVLTQMVGAPVADAGGPYTVAEGATLTLDAAKSSPGATIGWDINGDGDFTDATGRTPTLAWADLGAIGVRDGPAGHPVRARATWGKVPSVVSSPTTLTVTNTAPQAVVIGALTATVDKPLTIKVGADDPSSVDADGTFVYTVDWGDGTPLQRVTGPADPSLTHSYTSTGAFAASCTATDKDGGISGATALHVDVSPAAAPQHDGLAHTGSHVGPGTIALGGALLIIGATLVMVAHGRQRRDE